MGQNSIVKVKKFDFIYQKDFHAEYQKQERSLKQLKMHYHDCIEQRHVQKL